MTTNVPIESIGSRTSKRHYSARCFPSVYLLQLAVSFSIGALVCWQLFLLPQVVPGSSLPTSFLNVGPHEGEVRPSAATHTVPEPHRKWAYAFLVGGVRSTRPGSDYRGSLYSVVAIVHRLRSLHSIANFVLMVQVSPTTNATHLTPMEKRVFDNLNISIVYLPKSPMPEMETFYSLVVQGKFYVLNLVQYSRVMFLDVDIFPRCNLDYLFALSEPEQYSSGNNENNVIRKSANMTGPASLRENVVMGWKHEPSNAALFILKPQAGAYQNKLQPIIDQKEARPWDPILGWGFRILEEDAWIAPSGMTGTDWSWAYAFADQGLLYHWTKYEQRSVSLITPGKVVNWGTSSCSPSKVVCKQEEHLDILESHSCRPRAKREMSPYRDIFHFTGDRKPWWSNQTRLDEEMREHEKPTTGIGNTTARSSSKLNFRQEWYWHLKAALSDIGMSDQVLSLNFMGREETPPVGRSSSMEQMKKYVSAKGLAAEMMKNELFSANVSL